MSDIGWIKLHRKIQECWIWEDKPYDKARAWIDLLLLAMHRDKKLLIQSDIELVPRGSFMTSILKLSERWGWSRNKTLRFLNVLESEQMLNTKRTQNGTLITIENYGVYQGGDTTYDTANETTDGTTDGTTDEPQKKNVKNIKNNIIYNRGNSDELQNDKKKRFVPPTVEEVKAYCVERKNNVNAEVFVDFYQSKNWYIGKNKMKDWKAAIRTWEKKNKETSNTQKGTKFNNFPGRTYDMKELEKQLLGKR